MGNLLEKENEKKTIGELCRNNNIQPNDPNFSLITTIINDYFLLKQLINDSSPPSNRIITKKQIPFSSTDPSSLKIIINRIKKWIHAIQSSQPYLRRKKKLLTCKNYTKLTITGVNHIKIDKCTPKEKNKSIFAHYCSNANNFSMNKNNPQNNSNYSGNNLNTESSGVSENNSYISNSNNNDVCYNNTYIETGIGNFQRKNNSKFTQRMMKGPPRGFIIPSWITLGKIPSPRIEDLYEYYLNKDCNEILKAAILRDINRTFPETEYNKVDIDYKSHLYHVIKAFANLDTDLGYCQGMNFIVGFILLVTNFNEKDTFFLLISLFSETFQDNLYSVRGFYMEGFPLLLYFNYIFELTFIEHLPKLNKHFFTLDIPLDVWASRWFQTLFTVILPIEWCIRLWNCIFLFGLHFMIKFTIALLQVIESDLLLLTEEEDIIKYFNNLQQFPLSSDCENITQKSSIDKLIVKANKINIKSQEKKEKYIQEEQPDFDNILEELKIVYDLTVDMIYIQRCVVDHFEDAKSCESDNNSMQKNKFDPKEIITESSYENYNEDIDEMTIDLITDINNDNDNNSDNAIEIKKDYKRTITHIDRNLRNHELDIRSLKSDLDNGKLKSYTRFNSTVPTKKNIGEFKTCNTHFFLSAKGDY